MKRVAMLLILLCVLTGCDASSKNLERGLVLRDRLLSSRCAFSVNITADYGDSVHIFSMDCQADENGDMLFTVTEPDTISGITGTISKDGGKLTFDEALLQFDLLTDDLISPVSAPWILIKTLRGGYIRSAGMEDEMLRLTIDDSYEEDALMLDIWLDSENNPVRGEILCDGRRILTLDVSGFVFL